MNNKYFIKTDNNYIYLIIKQLLGIINLIIY